MQKDEGDQQLTKTARQRPSSVCSLVDADCTRTLERLERLSHTLYCTVIRRALHVQATEHVGGVHALLSVLYIRQPAVCVFFVLFRVFDARF